MGVKKFVGIGTCAEYQNSDKPMSINTPLEPKLLYSVSKVICFSVLSKYFLKIKKQNLPGLVFFIFMVREKTQEDLFLI